MPLPDYRIYRTGCGQYLKLSGTCCVCAMYVCSLPNSCEVLRGLSLQLCNPNTFLPFCFDKPVNGTTKVPQLPPAPGLNTWSGAAINEVGWVKLLLILIGSSYLNLKLQVACRSRHIGTARCWRGGNVEVAMLPGCFCRPNVSKMWLNVIHDRCDSKSASKKVHQMLLNKLAFTKTSLKVHTYSVITRQPLHLKGLLVKLKPTNLKTLLILIWLESHGQTASSHLLSWKGPTEECISQTWETLRILQLSEHGD